MPSRRNASASARPIPLAPPVTTATLPRNCFIRRPPRARPRAAREADSSQARILRGRASRVKRGGRRVDTGRRAPARRREGRPVRLRIAAALALLALSAGCVTTYREDELEDRLERL